MIRKSRTAFDLAQKGQIAGALVSIDAIGCNAGTAQAILDAGAD